MVKSEKNPEGTPIEVFDGFRAALAATAPSSSSMSPTGPFYGFNRRALTPIPGVIQNWWRQGMIGGAKAHYDGIKAFSETDQTADLEAITVPTLVLHGDDDQVVPYQDSAEKSVKPPEERHPQALQGLSPRHAYHTRRGDQPGPPRLRAD